MLKKMLKFGTLIAVAVCMFVFTGCTNFKPLSGGPSENDAVYGNGGIAVIKGDYAYYVNGYVSNANITSANKNKFGNVTYGAIYRTKLVDGKIVYSDDDELIVSSTGVVAPRVAGHEDTAIFIYDNYIYYSSPNTEKDKSGDIRNDLLCFYRAKLSGADSTLIYKATATSSNQSYTFTKINGVVYLINYDGTNLVSVNTSTKKAKTISSSATSVGFDTETTYLKDSSSVSEFNSYVYFTQANSDENAGGNVLAKAKITNGDVTVISENTSLTFTIKDVNNDMLFYTKANSLDSSSYTYSYSAGSEKLEFSTTFDSIYAVDFDGTAYNGFVGIKNSKAYYVTATNTAKVVVDGSLTVIGFNGNVMYYLDSDSNITKLDIKGTLAAESIMPDNFSVDTTLTRCISLVGGKVFFYKGYTNDNGTYNYLTMIDSYEKTDGAYVAHFIGKFKSGETPTVEEE